MVRHAAHHTPRPVDLQQTIPAPGVRQIFVTCSVRAALRSAARRAGVAGRWAAGLVGREAGQAPGAGGAWIGGLPQGPGDGGSDRAGRSRPR